MNASFDIFIDAWISCFINITTQLEELIESGLPRNVPIRRSCSSPSNKCRSSQGFLCAKQSALKENAPCGSHNLYARDALIYFSIYSKRPRSSSSFLMLFFGKVPERSPWISVSFSLQRALGSARICAWLRKGRNDNDLIDPLERDLDSGWLHECILRYIHRRLDLLLY